MKHLTFLRNIAGKAVCQVNRHWKRILPAVVLILLFHSDAWAAKDPFEEATKTIGDYADNVKKLVYVIAGVMSIVGAFNIFHKMQNGDQDVKKTTMLVIGGCIALVALATALPSFFDITVN